MDRDLLLLGLALGVGVPLLAEVALPEEHRETARDLTRIGLVSSLIGVPVGLIALPTLGVWPTTVILTGIGLVVKHRGLEK